MSESTFRAPFHNVGNVKPLSNSTQQPKLITQLNQLIQENKKLKTELKIYKRESKMAMDLEMQTTKLQQELKLNNEASAAIIAAKVEENSQLKATLNDLLDGHHKVHQNLENQQASVRQRQSLFTKALRELQEKNAELQEENANMSAKMLENTSRTECLQMQLMEALNEAEELRKTVNYDRQTRQSEKLQASYGIEEARRTMSNLGDQLDYQRQILQQKTMDLESNQLKVEEIKKELELEKQRYREKLEEVERKEYELKMENYQLQNEKTRHEQLNSKLKEEYKEIEVMKSNLELEKRHFEQQAKFELQTEKDIIEKKAKEISIALDELLSEREKFESEKLELTKQQCQLIADIERYKYYDIEAAQRKTKTENSIEEEKAKLLEKEKELELEKQNINEQIEQVNKDKAYFLELMEELKRQKDRLNEEQKQAEQIKIQYESKVEELEKEYKDKLEQNQQESVKLLELSSQLESKKESLYQEIRELAISKEEFRTSQEKWTKMMDSEKQDIETLKSTLENEKAKLTAKTNELQKEKEELTRYKDQLQLELQDTTKEWSTVGDHEHDLSKHMDILEEDTSFINIPSPAPVHRTNTNVKSLVHNVLKDYNATWKSEPVAPNDSAFITDAESMIENNKFNLSEFDSFCESNKRSLVPDTSRSTNRKKRRRAMRITQTCLETPPNKLFE